MIYYALLLFFVFEYVRPGTYLPVLQVLRLNTIIPLAAIGGTFVTKSPVSIGAVLRDGNTMLVAALLFLVGLSVLTADVTLYAYNVFVTISGYALITAVLMRQLHTVARVKGVFAVLVLVHVVLAVLTPEMFTDPDARHYLASGTFLGDGNDYALSVNVALPFCLFLMLDGRGVVARALGATALLLLVFCIVATKSRGGTLALLVVGVYYWLKSDRKLLLGGVTVVALAVVLATAPELYFQRMSTISADPQDSSAQRRIGAWGSGVSMALDHPLLGVGAGQFPGKMAREYRPEVNGESGRWMTAHSIYFLILGELGFPGISVLLGFVFGNLFLNRQLVADVRQRLPGAGVTEVRLLTCLSASVLAYATGGAFLSAAYYPHMFVLAGLSSAARRIVRTRLMAEQEDAAVTAPPPEPSALRWRGRPAAVVPRYARTIKRS